MSNLDEKSTQENGGINIVEEEMSDWEWQRNVDDGLASLRLSGFKITPKLRRLHRILKYKLLTPEECLEKVLKGGL